MINKLKNLINKFSTNLLFKNNKIIDSYLAPVEERHLSEICETKILDIPNSVFLNWLSESGYSKKPDKFKRKKALEFFFSSQLLNLESSDYVLDAAGGMSGYLDVVYRLYGCANRYLTDHIYSGISEQQDGLRIVGGDISSLPLEDESLTKISCHHAFEHFKEDKDVAFIMEIARLLKPNGIACIIPLFLATSYVECWNTEIISGPYDENAEVIFDKSATLPGSSDDGHFARIYNIDSFNRRILSTAETAGLEPNIYTCRLDGVEMPEIAGDFGSILNRPLRAFVLVKKVHN